MARWRISNKPFVGTTTGAGRQLASRQKTELRVALAIAQRVRRL